MGRQQRASQRQQYELNRAIGAVIEPVERRMMLAASLVLDGLGPTGYSQFGTDILEIQDRVIFTGQGYGQDADVSLWSTDGTAAGTYEIHDAIDFDAALVRMGDDAYFTENGRLYRSDGTPQGTELIATPAGLFVYGQGMEVSGDALYFAAADEAHGIEMWTTDGTAAGTHLVKDVLPGPASSGFSWAVGSDGALFFKANGNLYYTDGTEAGTLFLRPVGNITGAGYNAEVVNGTLYFPNIDPSIVGARLWKSDGTAAGTQVVEDGPGGTEPRWPMHLTAVGDLLYYTAESPLSSTRRLFRTDGTGYGTDDIFLPSGGGGGDRAIANLTAANGRLFFTARSSAGFGYGADVWQTSGTDATTSIVAANAFGQFSDWEQPPLRAANNALFYQTGNTIWRTNGTAAPAEVYTGDGSVALDSRGPRLGFANPTAMIYFADDGVHGIEPWVTNGAPGGAHLLADLTLRYGDYNQPEMFPYVGNGIGGIFVRQDHVKGREPWFTDGTPGGTFLLKDINANSPGYSPEDTVTVNGVTYFAITTYDQDTGASTSHLWRTDGTAGGTSLVKSFVEGALQSFCDFNGTLFFSAFDDVHGQELWKSDGTAAGTVMVKDIIPGTEMGNPVYLSVAGGTLYFSANDPVNGRELFKSDGTEAGTVRVADIVPGEGSSDPQPMHALGSLGIFTIWDVSDPSLYRTNGTEAGTFLLGDILLDEGIGNAVIGGNFYFAAYSAGHGYELWKTNGTVGGTQMVIEFGVGEANSDITWIAALNNTLYFMRAGSGLWASDGTAAGTSLVTTVPGNAYYPMVAGNNIYFGVNEPDNGPELWKTDGTAGGTGIVKDIRPGPDGSYPTGFVALGNTLYFFAHDGVHGEEMWKTDGTEANTVMVKDNWAGGFGGVYNTRGTNGNQVIFYGSDGASQGLFFTDGTEAGTHSIGAIGPETQDSNPYGFTTLADGNVYFFASDGGGSGAQQLYRTDGTTAGTVQLTNLASGPTWSSYGSLTSFNGDVYFFDGPRMWKVDAAAPEGATLVTEMPNSGSAVPTGMIEYNGKLYFSHNDIDYGQELWVSDGTADGTHLFLDINTNPFEGSDPINFVIGGLDLALYFIARDADHGLEIWKTDGTVGGTARLTDFMQDPWLGPSQLTPHGNTLYFTYFDIENGAELWRTDGSVGGTVRIADPDPAYPYNSITNLTAMGNAVYFIASDLAHGAELWTSDGTAAGTHIVRDIRTGASGADIRELRTIQNGDALAFTARDGIHGREVWISGGSAATTVLVDDIAPGAISSYPHGLVEGDGKLAFFAADDADGGRGIWSAPLPNGIFPSLGATWSLTGPEEARTITVSGGTVALQSYPFGNPSISVTGSGVLLLEKPHFFETISLSGNGRVAVAPGGNTHIAANTLDITGGGSIDLADNVMVLYGTSRADAEEDVRSAYNFGAWDGPGLRTSMPDAAAGLTTLGVARYGDLYGLGDDENDQWEGHFVTGATVIIKYTYAGDANLDGVIDGGDYGVIDNFVQVPGASGYANGDFNFDGVIDGGDYGIIDNNIQAQAGPL